MPERCPLETSAPSISEISEGLVFGDDLPAACVRCLLIARSGEDEGNIAFQTRHDPQFRSLRQPSIIGVKILEHTIDKNQYDRLGVMDHGAGRDTTHFTCTVSTHPYDSTRGYVAEALSPSEVKDVIPGATRRPTATARALFNQFLKIQKDVQSQQLLGPVFRNPTRRR